MGDEILTRHAGNVAFHALGSTTPKERVEARLIEAGVEAIDERGGSSSRTIHQIAAAKPALRKSQQRGERLKEKSPHSTRARETGTATTHPAE
jgi:hypothetical protein